MCRILTFVHQIIIVQLIEQLYGSMFHFKRRRKLWLTEKPLDRVPTRWKLVIAGLIGSGTGLLLLTMLRPGCTEEKSLPSNQSLKSTSKIQLLGRVAGVLSSGSDEKASVYCTIGACKTVTCSAIPDSLDPGQIAADFLTRVFKTQCPNTKMIDQLTFEDCSFPKNKLQRHWLTASLPIEKLSFCTCALTNIGNGAFASTIFANLNSLEITTANIRILKQWTFKELSNLKNLNIRDNIIHEAEYDLLQPVADSLEVLELDGCVKDVEVLLNITSGSILSKVELMSISRNFIGTISSKLFKSIPNVVSLYLEKSNVDNCEEDSFVNTRSLKQLYLTNNLLKQLPRGVFSALLNTPDFRVSMIDNPWNCVCEFQWIQEMIVNYPNALSKMPKCETPSSNAGLDFTIARFCDSNTTNSSTIESSVETTTPISAADTTQNNPIDNEDDEANFLRFTCPDLASLQAQRMSRRKLLASEEWKFPTRYRGFYAKPQEDGTILVNLESLSSISKGVSLMWFKSPEDEDLSVILVHCVRDVKGPFVLSNLDKASSYTVCLLEELDKAPSPFNCLATRTVPLTLTDTWLTDEDKAVVLPAFITLIIIVSIISVLSSFLLIRRNPSLLRGSKRVVMVRKREVEALVLPQGVRIPEDQSMDNSIKKEWIANSNEKKIAEPVYLTPLGFRKYVENTSPRIPPRKDSKASRVSSQYSGGSYVSGIEASALELANWGNNLRVTSYSTCLEDEELEEAPPLPPHHTRHRIIPSLSLSIDTNRDSPSPNFCIDCNDIESENSITKSNY